MSKKVEKKKETFDIFTIINALNQLEPNKRIEFFISSLEFLVRGSKIPIGQKVATLELAKFNILSEFEKIRMAEAKKKEGESVLKGPVKENKGK